MYTTTGFWPWKSRTSRRGRVPSLGRLELGITALLFTGLVGCGNVDRDGDGVISDTDCDDKNPLVGAAYADDDGDGYGSPEELERCKAPSGTSLVEVSGDCDDTNDQVYPGASEHCDTIDNDCDDAVDEEAIDPVAWYADLDQDGFGDTSLLSIGCTGPVGSVETAGDCDDSRSDIHPYAPELCDGIDGDCDEAIDEDAVDTDPWYEDQDGDGYGNQSVSVQSCEEVAGHVPVSGDCDDTRAEVHPGAAETCDGIDTNCDGDQDSAWLLPEGELGFHVVMDAAGEPTGTAEKPFASVGAALAATSPGCAAVRVRQGTYQESLGFPAHDVHVYAPAGEKPILHGNDVARVARFAAGSTSATLFEGFIIEHGKADAGGGILIQQSSPTLRRLEIRANESTGHGGGLNISWSSSRIEDCWIHDNEALGGGGGVYVATASPSFENCRFEKNVACGLSPLLDFTKGGGAILFEGMTESRLERCLLEGNRSEASLGGGGAIQANTTQAQWPTLSNTRIVGNVATNVGGGILLNEGKIRLENVVVARNDAWAYGGGGGIGIWNLTTGTLYPPSIQNSIIAYNSSCDLAAVWQITPLAYSSDHWAHVGSGLCNVTWPSGNFNVEPGFLLYEDSSKAACDPALSSDCLPTNYHLATGSALVDAGGTGSNLDPDGSPLDVGAYGGPDAGSFDLDWDGAPDWFWPGFLETAPEGFDPTAYDADDSSLDDVAAGRMCQSG